jgi:hypothetical protein
MKETAKHRRNIIDVPSVETTFIVSPLKQKQNISTHTSLCVRNGEVKQVITHPKEKMFY